MIVKALKWEIQYPGIRCKTPLGLYTIQPEPFSHYTLVLYVDSRKLKSWDNKDDLKQIAQKDFEEKLEKFLNEYTEED